MEIFRKYKLLLPLIVCVLVTLVMGIFLLMPDGGEDKESETDTESDTSAPETDPPVMDNPIFKTDLSAYEKYMDTPSGEYLVLVNKTHTIDGDDIPKNLVAVKDARKDIELVETAERALEAMFIEMRAAGFTDVFVTSAYRSYAYQNSLFNTYINKEMAADPSLTASEAREKVLRYSAYPGTSEHQTGLCVDLMTEGMRELDESFADYPVYQWLQENAWKFGFILRFPADKTDITGYDYEPWHYRFVGRYDAYMIHEGGLCLEEYVETYGN